MKGGGTNKGQKDLLPCEGVTGEGEGKSLRQLRSENRIERRTGRVLVELSYEHTDFCHSCCLGTQ